jgi:hypothetical protein
MDRYELVVRIALYLRTLMAPGWFEAQKKINHLAMFGTAADLEAIFPTEQADESPDGRPTIH